MFRFVDTESDQFVCPEYNYKWRQHDLPATQFHKCYTIIAEIRSTAQELRRKEDAMKYCRRSPKY